MTVVPAPSFSMTELRSLINDGMSFLGKDWQSFAVKYNFALTQYFESKVKSLSKIKVFYSSEVINLQDIYIPQNLKFKDEVYSQDDFLKLLHKDRKFVISATAGAGKSCMLKNMFLDILRYKKLYFPLFFELRKINEKQKTIIDSLVEDISKFNKRFSSNNLDDILNRGNTIIFLDGFDEVNHNDKERFVLEINEICEIYPDLMLVVSSRPEMGEFQDWSHFNVAKVEMLDIDQSVAMINKLNYDNEVTTRFVSSLRSNLYKKHHSFASNPLLLTIMLVTFEKYGEVPEKIHLFYDMAYQALFTLHDNSKQGYKRKSLTNLDMLEFKKVFSLFCLISYSKENFNFDNKFFVKYLRVCLDSVDYKLIEEKKLKIELMSSIPLIMQDGLNYCFSHRSFQEYFTAYYLTNTYNISEDIYEKISYRCLVDGVFDMAFEMDKFLIEEKWILPKIDMILEKLVDPTDYNNEYKNTTIFYEKCNFIKENESDDFYFMYIYHSSILDFINFLINKYNIRFDFREYSKFDSQKISMLSECFTKVDFSSSEFIDLLNLDDNEKKTVIEAGCGYRAKGFIDLLKSVRKIIKEGKKNAIDLSSILL